VISVSARRIVARALGGDAVDVGALVAARRACGSWRRLSEILREERLSALLGFYLGERDLPAGGDFKETLRSRARDVLAANLGRRKIYEVLRDILADAGIPALPIKGVDVAFAAYPNPACRPMTDVDILVSPESYKAAGDVLQREGFVPLPKEPRWWPARTFGRPGEMVDLHWSPAAAAPPRRETASRTFRENTKGSSDEFRLLVSVCHHQNHFFSLPLLDFYEALMLAGRVSWPRYWSLARRWGALRATRFVFALAQYFFGGRSTAGKFGILKTLARPAFSGADVGRGRRAAAVYALSLDNPAAAFTWSIRRPNWTRQILTRGSSAKSFSMSKKEKAL
jgi:hypothetical protein